MQKSGFKIKNFLFRWVEQYFFSPNLLQKAISIVLLPLTCIYCIIVLFKRMSVQAKDYGIQVVSIGNLVIGGTGKTPLLIYLAMQEKHPAIILRGYGRKSNGLHVVSNKGTIVCDINTSGDEAMLIAKSLDHATVIVDEKRINAIEKAKEMGCNIVFLDDGYRFHNIKKYDILIRPEIEPGNIFCLPSGGYKETKMMYSFVPCVLKDSIDFNRKITFMKNNLPVEVKNLPEKLLLLTAISKPERLYKYLPKNTVYKTFYDHYYFTYQDIMQITREYPNHTIVTTQKDFVKLEQFQLNDVLIMELSIHLNRNISYS